MDSFYTPTPVAETMVKYLRCNESKPIIADFAMGDGELLRAAVLRWPKATFIGNDLNSKVVSKLIKTQPSWLISKCDFLNNLSRGRSSILQSVQGQVSLILLNPPFSNRGARRFSVSLNDHQVMCSQGLAFVITAISYLKKGGEIVAVLPAGTLHSEMDKDAWQLVNRFCENQVLVKNGHNTFPDCSPKTIIIKLALRPKPVDIDPAAEDPPKKRLPVFVSLIRGKVDMTTLNGNHYRKPIPLIHSTELKANEINLNIRKINLAKTTLRQEAVLLPRVGRPNRGKLCLHLNTTPVALSSCVIAIKCKSKKDAKIVYQNLFRRWRILESTYAGTCAPYLTLNRLRLLLTQLGFEVEKNVDADLNMLRV